MYKQFSIPFGLILRPKTLLEEKVKLIKDIGCKRISIDWSMAMKNIVRIGCTESIANEQIVNACRILKEYEISFFCECYYRPSL